MSSEVPVLWMMFGSLVLLLLSGMPLAFVFGTLAVAFTLTLWGAQALTIMGVQIFSVMQSQLLLAVPLYVLMASILQRSGVIEALYSAMELWFSRLPGGLAVGTVVICMLMAAMTGIVGAAVAAMGILALPSMLERNYNRHLALGTICAGGTLGILIPPSVISIIYASTAQISVGKMFIGGVVPGLVLGSFYCGYAVLSSAIRLRKAPDVQESGQIDWRRRFGSLRALLLPSAIIFGMLGSIYAGIATPTEAAAVGVFGAIASMLLERKFSFSGLGMAAMDTLRVSAMILWITIGAKIFVAIFTGLGGANLLLTFIQDLEVNRWFVIIAMMGILMFLGMFLDEIGIILLCVPIFLPIVTGLGFDPLWFGILFLVTAQMAYISPPFGYTLFYLKGVLPPGIGMGDVYRAVIPFLILQVIALALFMIWPELVTWLPRQ